MNNEEDVVIHLTQCCGSTIFIYTDYREDGELLIPLCFNCKQQVTLEGGKLDDMRS